MTGHFEDCGDVRNALGVYVLGAIDPGERSTVDSHLVHCPDCREELAGLAGLPALLGRVPVEDAERLVLGDEVLEEPPAELLDSLLDRVSTRRRGRRLRLVTAVAAAAVVAVGGGIAGGTVISHLQGTPAQTGPAAAMTQSGLSRGSNADTHVDAAVYYDSTPAGTRMMVQVTGVRPGDPCVFWAITSGGTHLAAGQWTATADGATWYSGWTPHPVTQLKGFDVSVHNKVIVRVPLR